MIGGSFREWMDGVSLQLGFEDFLWCGPEVHVPCAKDTNVRFRHFCLLNVRLGSRDTTYDGRLFFSRIIRTTECAD